MKRLLTVIILTTLLAGCAREKVKYAQIIHELIQATNPDLRLSSLGPEDLAIPRP